MIWGIRSVWGIQKRKGPSADTEILELLRLWNHEKNEREQLLMKPILL